MKKAKWLAALSLICLIGLFSNGCLHNLEDVDTAYEEGYNRGISVGYDQGYEAGYEKGNEEVNEKSYKEGYIVGRLKGKAAGSKDCEEYRNPLQWSLLQRYCDIGSLLDQIYSLAGGDYEFGYYVAGKESGWPSEPLFLYNFVRSSYEHGELYVDGIADSTNEYCHSGIYVISPEEFRRGYAAYGVYLRDEYLPQTYERFSEWLSEEALAFYRESGEERIERYLSVENDEWGEPCFAAQDSWLDELSDEFYKKCGDNWVDYMDWVKENYPNIYHKFTWDYIEYHENLFKE